MWLQNHKRRGLTILDSLCGLVLISSGLWLYCQTSQIINHGLAHSKQELNQNRLIYEKTMSKTHQH